MTIQKPIVEMIADVVNVTQAVILPYLKTVDPKIELLHYEHGHPREITNTLATMNEVQEYQFRKYPLIGLFQDFRESPGKGLGQYGTVSLQIIIANQTQPTYLAKERYEHNFKPILYPIYEEFLRQLKKSMYFQVEGELQPSKIDRLFWGKQGLYGNEANIFKDMLDCIEIQEITLIVKKTQCTLQSFNKLTL